MLKIIFFVKGTEYLEGSNFGSTVVPSNYFDIINQGWSHLMPGGNTTY